MTQKFSEPVPVTVHGVQYHSMYEAAKKTGITRAAISKVRQRKGDEGLATHVFIKKASNKKIKVEHNGEWFPSIRAWAVAKGYNPSGAAYRAMCMRGVTLHREP
jgi:hypothetical protein